jgi:hypothetical protein
VEDVMREGVDLATLMFNYHDLRGQPAKVGATVTSKRSSWQSINTPKQPWATATSS